MYLWGLLKEAGADVSLTRTTDTHLAPTLKEDLQGVTLQQKLIFSFLCTIMLISPQAPQKIRLKLITRCPIHGPRWMLQDVFIGTF
jgi:hypothetical protein